ncbi:hypothetical protein Taro_044765 [Colocasia esculenta]|uniref:RNase H type-1 domain-containing protein n=1 Tax=Colocasia esculenta TaxID=4460 RepID=A0A843X1G5_COLES|nr:hypothetical protein [Colocasia esculenta]
MTHDVHGLALVKPTPPTVVIGGAFGEPPVIVSIGEEGMPHAQLSSPQPSINKPPDLLLKNISELAMKENIYMPNVVVTVEGIVQKEGGVCTRSKAKAVTLASITLDLTTELEQASFCDINDKVRTLEYEVKAKQEAFDINSTTANRSSLEAANANLKRAIHCLEMQTLHDFGYVPLCPIKKLKLIRWIPPICDFSLNVDGACKRNPGECGGGGCIRDPQGHVHVAFTHFYGTGTSMIAEMRALCDGLRLASSLGFNLSTVYSDSLVLVNSIRENKTVSWRLYRWWRELSIARKGLSTDSSRQSSVLLVTRWLSTASYSAGYSRVQEGWPIDSYELPVDSHQFLTHQ